MVLVPAWGGSAAAVLGDELQREVLYSAWIMNFFPQTLLQSAKHSLSTEDTIDFTCDRYA